MDPIGCEGLFLLLNLLWEVLECTSDLVRCLVVLIRLDVFNSKEAWWSLYTPSIVFGADADELDKPAVSSDPPD